MRKTTLATAAVATFAALYGGTPVQALSSKTWVAENGSDTNPCSSSAPCRTFSGAYSRTAPGGEIGVLGPADYGTLAITQAVSVLNDGAGEAAVQPGNNPGIWIAAGASDVVQLRGLVLDGAAATVGAPRGIFLSSGASLSVRNCVIKNFQNFGYGIFFQPNAAAVLTVSDTTLENNAYADIYVTNVFDSANVTVTVALERVIASGGSYGIIAVSSNTAAVNMTVTDSLVSGNGYGVLAIASSSAPLVVMVERSKSVNNITGVYASGANATVLLSNSTVTGNTNGLTAIGGAVLGSYGNNNIDKNGTDGAPTKTFTQK